jgi:hypothetical protein
MSIWQWHKSHWQETDTYLDEAIENFNSLIDEKESPSVHTVRYSLPLDYDINKDLKDNVLFSDISRGEQVKDLKLMHVKLESKIREGSMIWWNNNAWIVLNEENNAVLSHRTYSIQKCGININLAYDDDVYSYPVAITNLTLYSDGLKELVNLSVSSAKYSIQIVENEVTNLVNVGTRFIIRGRAFEVSLIDDFTIKNVRTFTVCETVANSLDDMEEDIAYNDEFKYEEDINPNIEIKGKNKILLGETTEYILRNAKVWEIDDNDALEIISWEIGKCKIKCKSESEYVGTKVKLRALTNTNRILDEIEITVRGLF